MVATLVVNGIVQAAAVMAIALLARRALDGIDNLPDWHVFLQAAALCGAAAFLVVLRTAEAALAERLGQSYLTASRLRLFEQLSALPSRVLQRRTRGVMMVRFFGDLNALHDWVSFGISRMIVSLTTSFAALAALFVVSPLIATAVLVVLTIMACLVVTAGPALYRRVRETRRRRGHLAANLGDKLVAPSPVSVFGRTDGESNRLRLQSKKLADAAVAQTRLAAVLRFLPESAVPFALTVILLGAAMLSATGQPMSAGDLIAAVLIINLLSSPLRDLTEIFVYCQAFRAARDVLGSFLALPKMACAEPGYPHFALRDGRLGFEEVTVEGSLYNISAIAEPRSLVAITGPSGSGKSTLLALAARLLDPDRGQVVLDGQTLAFCELSSVRQSIGLVAAELPLLRGTIRRNLTYRAKDTSDADVAHVLKLCGLEEVIATLEKGLDTRVIETGANLPAAVRQRLALARAVLGAPAVLLIDDADTFTDEESKAALNRVLRRRTVTTLFVTGDRARMESADAVWRLANNGRGISIERGAAADSYRDVVPLWRA
jgi:ABC-type multidrug transport system fused ATPase/permease subunit